MAVWVGNLNVSVTEEDLKLAFSSCIGKDTIVSCTVKRNDRGQSKKFGYVNFDLEAVAEEAAAAMDGYEIHSVRIKTKGPGALRSEGHVNSANTILTDCLYYGQVGGCKKGDKV